MPKINKNALDNFETFCARNLCKITFPGARDHMKVMQWQWTRCFALENQLHVFSTHAHILILQSYCKAEFQIQISGTSSDKVRLGPGSYSNDRKPSATSLSGDWCRQESIASELRSLHFKKKSFKYFLVDSLLFKTKYMCMFVLPGYLFVCAPLVYLVLTEAGIGHQVS